jgi:hypothetical protein
MLVIEERIVLPSESKRSKVVFRRKRTRRGDHKGHQRFKLEDHTGRARYAKTEERREQQSPGAGVRACSSFRRVFSPSQSLSIDLE